MIKLKKSKGKGYFLKFTNWMPIYEIEPVTWPIADKELKALYLLLHKHFNK